MQDIKAYKGPGVQLHTFFTERDGGELPTSHPDCFTSGERTPVPIEQEAE
jgi:hypothetical protein